MALVTDGGEETGPRPRTRAGAILRGVPSVHHRPGYPLAGCTPAEPASVWPGTRRSARRGAGASAAVRGRQPQQAGNREAGRVVAVRKVSEGNDTTPDGLERPVNLVTIGVP